MDSDQQETRQYRVVAHTPHGTYKGIWYQPNNPNKLEKDIRIAETLSIKMDDDKRCILNEKILQQSLIIIEKRTV